MGSNISHNECSHGSCASKSPALDCDLKVLTSLVLVDCHERLLMPSPAQKMIQWFAELRGAVIW